MDLQKILQVVKSDLSDLSTLENPDFRIEQAKLNQAGDNYEVIISFLVERKDDLGILSGISSPYERVYKRIDLDQNLNLSGFYIYEPQ